MTSTLRGLDRNRHAAVRALLVHEATPAPAAALKVATSAAGTPTPIENPSTRRPVWKRPVPRRIGLAFVSVTAVAVTSAVMLTGDPAAPASYASWTAVPASATTTADAARQAEADLQAGDDRDIDTQASKCTDLTGGGVGIGGVPARPEAAERRSVLVDRRGDWTFCVDITKGAGTENDPLIVLGGLKGEDAQQTSGTVWDKPYTWPTGIDVDVLGGRPYAIPDEDPVTVNYSLIGSLGPGVSGVDINLADGTTITTTVHDDFWAAWWPGRVSTARVNTLTVHTTTITSYDVDPRTIELPWAESGARVSDWP